MNEETLKKLLPDLRALRLWHWKQLVLRRRAEFYYSVKDERLAAIYKSKADFHLAQVQLLNSFFEVGDTAEQDMSK